MALSGYRRTQTQLSGEQANEERDRFVDGATPLGDADPLPEPVLNDDGSAVVDLPDEALDVEEQTDGSAVIRDEAADAPADPSAAFDENLAETVSPTLLATLAIDLIDDIERDKESRKKRDEQYAEGIRRTGLGDEAPGGATFEGASRAVHPALVEGCIDFAARAIKELFPANGPVKSRIIGKTTKAKLQRADRKTQYLNWQCTTQIKELRRDLEVLLTQLPLGGGQYLKGWYDPVWERIRTEFVPIDDLLMPFEATSLLTAQRLTHVMQLTRAQLDERIESKLYRRIPVLGEAITRPDQTESAKAAAAAEGVEDLGFNEDGQRTVYETQVYLDLDGEDSLAKRARMPYIITIDESSREVLALYRNWDEDDQDNSEALSWIIEFPFIPWRGAYPIGLAHVIGSLSGAATGALRALLDSAHINNMPGGVKLAGARVTGQDIRVEPTQLTNIDAGPGVDDIRKVAMPFPFNPPSAVLFQLLQFVTEQAKSVVATASEKIADAGANTPVGTTLALIEQGSITFSSIHARLHNAIRQLLALFHRLNAKYLTDREVVEELGELVVSRRDFTGPMDIEPVSDPNIFSDSQRYAQLQAVLQLANGPDAQLYKRDELNKRALRLLKVPAPDELLNVPEDPEELDPVSENVASHDPQKSLKVYDGQDHLAHLKVHLAFMGSPVFCASPLMGIPALPVLLKHCKEHLVQLYADHAAAATEAQLLLTRAQGSVSGAEADAVAIAEQELVKQLAPLMPGLQQAQVLVQQLMKQNAPPDPMLAAAQLQAQSKDREIQQRAQEAAQEAQRADQALQLDAQDRAQTQARETQRLQLDAQGDADERAAAVQRDQLSTQLEEWQTKLEMGVASRNADLAAQAEQQQNQFKLMLSHLEAQQQRERDELSGKLQLVLELLKQRGTMAEIAANTAASQLNSEAGAEPGEGEAS